MEAINLSGNTLLKCDWSMHEEYGCMPMYGCVRGLDLDSPPPAKLTWLSYSFVRAGATPRHFAP